MKKTKMIKKNYEFKYIMTRGKYYSGRNIEVFIKNNNENCNYIGLAINTKIAIAVRRNRIKRLIRECYKELEEEIVTGKSIVFLWKKNIDIKNATYGNIKKDMYFIFQKSNILENL